jgi:hypothetical protein
VPHLSFFALSEDSLRFAYKVLASFLLAFLFGKFLALLFQRELSFALISLGCLFVQGFPRSFQFIRSRGSEGGTEVALNDFNLTLTFVLILSYGARMTGP